MAGPWITYPPPTVEDGDDDGDVLVQADGEDPGFRVVKWDCVLPYQPWIRIHEAMPIKEAKKRPTRKIAQLITANGLVLAVSDDGAAFSLKVKSDLQFLWEPLPPLPQP
jgi:hypothetical protein